MNALELAALLGDLPDEMVVVDDAQPAAGHQKRVYLIPVFAAAAVMLIGFVLYPKLKIQKPDTLPAPVYTAASAEESNAADTAPLLTDLSSGEPAGTTRTESPAQTTGTTVRTTTVTAHTTVTGQTAVSGTTRTAAVTSLRTPHTTNLTGAATVTTRKTTVTRQTSVTRRTTTTGRTTEMPLDETTIELETTVLESASGITTSPRYNISVPVFRSETESFTPEKNGGWPGPVKATLSFLSDEDLQCLQESGLIPFDADLSAYDLIRVDMEGEGQKTAVTGGDLQNGILRLQGCYVMNPREQKHAYGVRAVNIVAIPKEYGITPDRCTAEMWGVNHAETFDDQLGTDLNTINILIYL